MSAFGIELELLLTFRDLALSTIPKDLKGRAGFLVLEVNKITVGPRVHSDIDGEYEGPNENTEWSITDDTTLRTNNHESQWPIEIISPVLQFRGTTWSGDIGEMWDCVNVLCAVDTNRTCATHVHVSPGLGVPWKTEELKSIACAIIHFEDAFQVLLPIERRQNEYAKSNRLDNERLSAKTLDQCFEMIAGCTSNVDVADLLNDGGDRYYAWNFTNLYFGRKMTVEFRSPPGVTNAEASKSWIELTVSFVEAARHVHSLAHMQSFPPTVSGLLAFINEGITPGFDKPSKMLALFAGKSGATTPLPIASLSAPRLGKLAEKKVQDDKKNVMVKKILASP